MTRVRSIFRSNEMTRSRWLFYTILLFLILFILIYPPVVRMLQMDTGISMKGGWWLAYYSVSAFLLVLCTIFVIQRKKSLSITSIPASVVFAIPGALLLVLVVEFFVFRSENYAADLSLAVGTVFGLASVLGLAISIAVLVNIHRAITHDIELLEESIKLIKSVKRKLIFIALSPNLGYAACVKGRDDHLMDAFFNALKGTLSRLGKAPDSEVRMAYLDDSDIRKFFTIKSQALALDSIFGQTEDKIYMTASENLLKMIDQIFNTHKTEHFCLKKLKNGIADEGQLEMKEASDFPPLSMLIADDQKAIVFYNPSLFSPEATPLQGHIATLPDHVRFLSKLSESYYHMYTKS